jgi:hypothetical protein
MIGVTHASHGRVHEGPTPGRAVNAQDALLQTAMPASRE